MSQSMSETNKLYRCLKAPIICFIGLLELVLTGCNIRTELYTAEVIEKYYIPSSSSVGVGTGIGSNGSVATVVTSNYEDEKYILIVKREDNGKIEPQNVDSQKWASVEKGQIIELKEVLFF